MCLELVQNLCFSYIFYFPYLSLNMKADFLMSFIVSVLEIFMSLAVAFHHLFHALFLLVFCTFKSMSSISWNLIPGHF